MRVSYQVVKSDDTSDVCDNCQKAYSIGAVVWSDENHNDIILCKPCLTKLIEIMEQVGE